MYSRFRVCPVSACYLTCKSLSSWEKRLRIFFHLIMARAVLSEIRPDNLEGHEVRMRVRPRDGLELARRPPA